MFEGIDRVFSQGKNECKRGYGGHQGLHEKDDTNAMHKTCTISERKTDLINHVWRTAACICALIRIGVIQNVTPPVLIFAGIHCALQGQSILYKIEYMQPKRFCQ